MKKIFLGFAFEKNRESELMKVCKSGVSMAVNQYQLGFLKGLDDKNIDIFSATAIGAFPKKCRKLFFKKAIADTAYGKMTYLPFVNFYFIREWMFYRHTYRSLKASIDQKGQNLIYVYSLYIPFMRAVKKLKKRNKNLHCSIIVTDLPGKYGFLADSNSLQAMKDKSEEKRKFKLAETADSFVLLTETMAEVLPKRPYTVIEGFLPQQKFDYSNEREPKTILYTGSLNAAFGVDKLLRAFEQITDPDYRLWICGAGGIQSTAEEYAKRDSRITYFGFLPKEKIADLQTRCDVLINPRSNSGEYTKYSFPSKTMEYLLSGSKVLMYRLPGVPEEYYDYIYTIDGSTSEDIAAAIIKACEDKSFQARRTEQIEWIKTHKNNQAQMKKLTELLNEI